MGGLLTTVRRQLVWCAVAALSLIGVTSCASATVTCAGQCAPPYELEVSFHPGTTHATAEKVLRACADHNPVVISIGKLQNQASGWSRALIYTHVFGKTTQTAGLLKCLKSSGLAFAAWPD